MNKELVFPLWETGSGGIRLNALSNLHLLDAGYGKTDDGYELTMFKFEVLDTGDHVLEKVHFDDLFDFLL